MIDISKSINVERVTNYNGHYFFGYYDLSPESPDGSKILCNRSSYINRMPGMEDTLEIGYFECGSDVYHKIGETHAWNFQEGCRLQWLDNENVIYNDRDKNGICSIVYNIKKNLIVKKYDIPIYSLSSNKQIATSYGFINNKYSYAHTKEESMTDKYGDGVYLLNLDTGDYHLILPVDILAEYAESKQYHNWVEYCSFSPDGNYFFMIHRWDNHGKLMGNQLCVSDIEGKVKVLLNSKFISHTGWRGNDELSAWARLPGGINNIQRNKFLEKTGLFRVARDVYHTIVKKQSIRQKFTHDAYILFDLEGNSKKKISNVDFTSDGHCTWSKNKRFMLTDTYSDMEGKRSLMIYDSVEDEVILLGKFYAFPEGVKENFPHWDDSPLRCDLHPKWSFDERHIYFDSVHEGMRGLYRVNVTKIVRDSSWS